MIYVIRCQGAEGSQNSTQGGALSVNGVLTG
jgi:hypothetical protein